MSTRFSKRFSSFLIDAIIISCIMNIFTFIIPTSKNYKTLNEELTKISDKLIDGKINEVEYINQSASLTYRIDKERFLVSILNIVISILYYVVFQFVNNGQTLGKKLLKIKVVKQNGELQINDLIYRSFIINSILYSMITLVLLFTTKDVIYLYSISILGIIQFLAIIVSCAMMNFRKDRLALQDIITKTKVIEV